MTGRIGFSLERSLGVKLTAETTRMTHLGHIVGYWPFRGGLTSAL